MTNAAPCARCNELNCTVSWAGNNVHGNDQSINAVKEAVHYAGQVPELKERVVEQQTKITEQAAEIERLKKDVETLESVDQAPCEECKRLTQLQENAIALNAEKSRTIVQQADRIKALEAELEKGVG